MKSTIINYIICTILLGAGIVLIFSDDLSTIILGVLWFVSLYISSTNKVLKSMWKSYIRTTMRIEKILGIY